MSTRRVVLVVLLVAGAVLGVAVGLADGSWRDLWLNLFAEAVGAAFIVLFVDLLFERSEARERDGRRRAALHELGSTLRQLQAWLVGMLMAPGATSGTSDADALSASLNSIVKKLGRTDFGAPGILRRDRYLVEWARRSFDETTIELGRWELSFADSAGLSMTTSVKAPGASASSSARWAPSSKAWSSTSCGRGRRHRLTAENAGRLVSELQTTSASSMCAHYTGEIADPAVSASRGTALRLPRALRA
jgi:hypothetical protein